MVLAASWRRFSLELLLLPPSGKVFLTLDSVVPTLVYLFGIFVMTDVILSCPLVVCMLYICWEMRGAAVVLAGITQHLLAVLRSTVPFLLGLLFLCHAPTFCNAISICGSHHPWSSRFPSGFLGLCNSWSLLCSSDVCEEEILDLRRERRKRLSAEEPRWHPL